MGAAAIGSGPVGTPNLDALYLVAATRDGFLRAYPTRTPSDPESANRALREWPEFGHDAFNSGNYHTDAQRPNPVSGLQATVLSDGRVELRFNAGRGRGPWNNVCHQSRGWFYVRSGVDSRTP